MGNPNLMTESQEYNTLADRYGNFEIPAAAIYLKDSKDNVIQSKNLEIEEIQVTLSADEASSVSFRIGNAFDLESWSIRQEVKDAFALGTIISVALGYCEQLTTVFKGYIEEFCADYQTSPTVVVTAMDLRKRLMQYQNSMYKYSDCTYSELFQTLLEKHSDLYDNLNITATADKIEIIQNGDDFRFIKEELCARAERDFYVAGGEVYFIKPEDGTKAFLTLEWGKHLLSFEQGSRYCNRQIKICCNQENKEENAVTQDLKTYKDISSLEKKVPVDEYEMEVGASQQELNHYMEKMAAQKKQKQIFGSGTVLGIPEIVPGRHIKISNVDESTAGIYYISEVCHHFDSDGFTTRFVIGNREDKWSASFGEEEKKRIQNKNKYGVMRAVVKENWNEDCPGKILVEFQTGESGKSITKWLSVAHPYCGNGYGFYFLPEIDTEVLVGSLAGDVNSLVVLGGLWNQVDKIPEKTAVEKNTIKKIKTKGGHEICFNDDDEAGGIEIKTAGDLHITMKDKDSIISVSDKEGKNAVKIDGKNGCIQICADKKLTFSVGGKNMAVLDGDNKKLSFLADQINQKAGQTLQLEGQMLKIKGDTTQLKGGSSMKLESSGMAEIKGSMVKIN
ncbi:MAG: phage baseplate assembly protein V [Lachnospiraceae bacterium]|nr:phage baseplate assembly protein V [Lachnospiraceae bacterium]